ncbi:MAG: SDR family oxidoreductase, partial [Lachnospiraceae bacterium]|nr:SDR family oxidoreductase [Lachnospiraceae bacterium]
GTIDLLVNNAGINRDGLLAMMKESAFDEVIDANLKGTFNMIRQCAPIFMKQRYGRIVNMSSVAGIIGNPGQVNYSASKAGIIGLTKSVARELASRNVTCNAVAPGFVATDMVKELTNDTAALEAQVPLGRLGKPEEIAEAAAFLLNSDYITGAVLQVDGGIAM